jgi:hypothetical protein
LGAVIPRDAILDWCKGAKLLAGTGERFRGRSCGGGALSGAPTVLRVRGNGYDGVWLNLWWYRHSLLYRLHHTSTTLQCPKADPPDMRWRVFQVLVILFFLQGNFIVGSADIFTDFSFSSISLLFHLQIQL